MLQIVIPWELDPYVEPDPFPFQGRPWIQSSIGKTYFLEPVLRIRVELTQIRIQSLRKKTDPHLTGSNTLSGPYPDPTVFLIRMRIQPDPQPWLELILVLSLRNS